LSSVGCAHYNYGMLKTGIYRPEHLTLTALDGFFGRRRFVAVTLYPEVVAGDSLDRDRLLERILARFPAANGTFKRTQRRRFDEFDAKLVEVLRERLTPGTPVAVHDMAVSDGRTAVDLFNLLDDSGGMDLQFLASDASPDVEAISSSSSSVVVVADPDTGAPLQVVRPPFVFNVQQPESALLYPINRVILGALLRTRVAALLKRRRAGDPRLTVSRIRLLSPDCLRLVETDPRFRFIRHNLFDEPPGQFDLVRAMNVLNRSYFPDATIGVAIERIHDSLRPGGLFATGSNQDAGSPVNGAIYERTSNGFRALWVSADGSPVHHLVLAHDTGRSVARGA
jgi:chemotaxis methyl-accepting protein methylase